MAKRRGLALDGVLLLDKPVGLSSNHALQRAKRTVDAAKAGHTGTLDPFATGLLLCCMGRATKISGAMLNADKTYRATLQFGEETDSGDLTGNVAPRPRPASRSRSRRCAMRCHVFGHDRADSPLALM